MTLRVFIKNTPNQQENVILYNNDNSDVEDYINGTEPIVTQN